MFPLIKAWAAHPLRHYSMSLQYLVLALIYFMLGILMAYAMGMFTPKLVYGAPHSHFRAGDDSVPDYSAILEKLAPNKQSGETHELMSDNFIDMLFVYTDAVVEMAQGESRAQLKLFYWTEVANQTLANSSIAIAQRFRIVGFHRIPNTGMEVENSSESLHRLTYLDGVADDVHAVRDSLGADVVSGIVSATEEGNGGRAWIWTNPGADFAPQAFSVLRYVTSSTVLAHELGHNLGLGHNPEQSGNSGMYSDSHGFNGVHAYCNGNYDGCETKWMTVMSYPVDINAGWEDYEKVVKTYSTPIHTHEDYPLGNHQSSFASSTVELSTAAASTWREQQVPPHNPFAGPQMLSASTDLSLFIRVEWEEYEGAIGYLLYRSSYPWGNCHESQLISSTYLSSTTVGTSTAGDYYFQVRAIVDGKLSECSSNFVQGTALPGAPEIVDFSVSQGTNESGVRISWLPYGYSADKVLIYRSNNPNNTGCTGSPITQVVAHEGEYLDTNAAPGEHYYYSAHSNHFIHGSGPCTSIEEGWTAEFLAPTNVSASDGLDSGAVEISWSPSSNPVDGYKIYRTPDTSSPEGCELDGSVHTFTLAGGDSTSFSDDTLPFPDVAYSYSMRSFRISDGGNEILSPNCSNIDQGHFSGIVPPPFIIASNGAFPNEVFITWYTIQAAIGYEIYRNATCDGEPIATLPYWQPYYWDDELRYPQTSFYAVRSIGPNGTSVCSTPDEGWPGSSIKTARPTK